MQFEGCKILPFLIDFNENTKNQAKILQSCFLQIAISQDWIGGFLISQRLWVRKACGQILQLKWFHNSCKQSFYVTKTPKIHLRLHSTVTVFGIQCNFGTFIP